MRMSYAMLLACLLSVNHAYLIARTFERGEEGQALERM